MLIPLLPQMRATLAGNCTRSSTLFGKGIVLYEKADKQAKPTTTPYHLPELNCANVSLTSLFHNQV